MFRYVEFLDDRKSFGSTWNWEKCCRSNCQWQIWKVNATRCQTVERCVNSNENDQTKNRRRWRWWRNRSTRTETSRNNDNSTNGQRTRENAHRVVEFSNDFINESPTVRDRRRCDGRHCFRSKFVRTFSISFRNCSVKSVVSTKLKRWVKVVFKLFLLNVKMLNKRCTNITIDC